MASNEPSEILDGLIHIYECDEQKVSGVIAPTDGIYRENLSVYVQDGNTELASGTTNSNGIFNISFFLPVGQYDPIIKCGNNTKSIYESGLRSLACSLTLTSDKDILSAADNDSATLSATLKCTETNEFLSNRNITFEITKDDTVIQTLVGQTNSSGVATVTYESQGLGDISVTARIGSISAQIFVTDINYANIGDTDKSSDFNVSGMIIVGGNSKVVGSTSLTWDTDHYTYSRSGAGNWNICPITQLSDITGDFEVSMKAKGVGLAFYSGTHVYGISHEGSGESRYVRVMDTYTNSNTWSAPTIASNMADEYCKVIIQKESNTYTFAVYDLNNNKLGETTKTLSLSTHTFGLWVHGTNNALIRELMLKQS